jgi:hypothetical protein
MPPDPTPLDAALSCAIATAEDDMVRDWLAALLVQGEAAGSATTTTSPVQSTT